MKLGTAVALTSGSATSSSTSTITATTAAGHVVTAAYTPSGGFTASSGTLSGGQVVNQAAPHQPGSKPSGHRTYGTPLSATQLDATSPVAGTFSYSPPAGTVQPAGNRVMFATFTPTDTTDYITTVQSAEIIVHQATPTITWPTPAPITYGTALGATQLDATSSVPGAFAYSPPAGTVLGAGTQTLSATFTPTDTADYTTVARSVSLTIAATTTTTLMSSVNPSLLGQPITFTATVTPTSGAVPTGTVTFQHLGTVLSGSSRDPLNSSGVATVHHLVSSPGHGTYHRSVFGQHHGHWKHLGGCGAGHPARSDNDGPDLESEPVSIGPTHNLYRDRDADIWCCPHRHRHLPTPGNGVRPSSDPQQ